MFNKVILVGRLTHTPELKKTQSGVCVSSFSIAVDRPYTPKGQERQVDFVEIVAWRHTAEFICTYFGRGNPVLIEGSLQSRSYVDKSGQNRKVWEVIADNARFVESKNKSPKTTGEPGTDIYPNEVDNDFEEIDDYEDLPF